MLTAKEAKEITLNKLKEGVVINPKIIKAITDAAEDGLYQTTVMQDDLSYCASILWNLGYRIMFYGNINDRRRIINWKDA